MQSGTRIQKILSDQGILSRRKAEEAILKNRLTVNGRPAKLGQKINPKTDIISLDGQRLVLQKKPVKRYILLYKPRGYVTTTDDTHGRRTVMDLVKGCGAAVYPVGRLDLNSEGLLLMTNDGNFANSIMHPSGEISKTYRVTVRGEVHEENLIELSTGILLDDGHKTAPASVIVLDKKPDRSILQFTVHEGRNRLIRRMCEAVHLDVLRLKRISIGPLKLGMLAPGKFRELKPSELEAIRGAIGKAKRQSTQTDKE